MENTTDVIKCLKNVPEKYTFFTFDIVAVIIYKKKKKSKFKTTLQNHYSTTNMKLGLHNKIIYLMLRWVGVSWYIFIDLDMTLNLNDEILKYTSHITNQTTE